MPSHKNFRTLKHIPWSKINLKNTNTPEFTKERIQKSCTHDNSKFLYHNKYWFYFLNRFRLNNPQKILNRRF